MTFKKRSKAGCWRSRNPQSGKFGGNGPEFSDFHAISGGEMRKIFLTGGFDEPAYEVTITDSEKGEVTFDTGNKDSDEIIISPMEKNYIWSKRPW